MYTGYPHQCNKAIKRNQRHLSHLGKEVFYLLKTLSAIEEILCNLKKVPVTNKLV